MVEWVPDKGDPAAPAFGAGIARVSRGTLGVGPGQLEIELMFFFFSFHISEQEQFAEMFQNRQTDICLALEQMEI